MKIHALTDNMVEKRGLLAEHGLSIYIEADGFRILFDTGQSDVYKRNAHRMGIDFSQTDCIVLSHGHYDHCGGLQYFPPTETKIYAHKAALDAKYTKNPDESYRPTGIPWSLNDHAYIKDNLVFNQKDLEIKPGISLHGNISTSESFEGVPQNFFVDKGTLQPDTMADEQMLVIDRHGELTVFLGCSHPGIISCLKHALSLYPGRRVNTVLGGMHLSGCGSARIQATIATLHKLNIDRIIPMHCTGQTAICKIKDAFGQKAVPLCTGQTIEV